MQSIEPELDKIRVFFGADLLNLQFSEDFNNYIQSYHPNEELNSITIRRYVNEYVSLVYELILSKIQNISLEPSELFNILKVVVKMPEYKENEILDRYFGIDGRQVMMHTNKSACTKIYTNGLKLISEDLKTEYIDIVKGLIKNFMIAELLDILELYKTEVSFESILIGVREISTRYSSILSETDNDFISDINKSCVFIHMIFYFISKFQMIDTDKFFSINRLFSGGCELIFRKCSYFKEHPDEFIQEFCHGIMEEENFQNNSVITLSPEIQKKILKYTPLCEIQTVLYGMRRGIRLKNNTVYNIDLIRLILNLLQNDLQNIFETEIQRLNVILNSLQDQDFLERNTFREEDNSLILTNDDIFIELEDMIDEIFKIITADENDPILK